MISVSDGKIKINHRHDRRYYQMVKLKELCSKHAFQFIGANIE